MRERSSISLAVGRSCFVKCPGCYNHFSKIEELVDNTTILTFLKVARAHGLESVTYCGGDPLSRPGIVDLLRATKKLGLTVKLDTVGTPLLGPASTIFFGRHDIEALEIEEIVRVVDHFGIPIDGSSNEVMAAFRQGREKLLDEQLVIVSRLAALGARVSVNTVVTSKNLDDIEGMARVISSVAGAITWEMFQFSPTGPMSFRNRENYKVSDSDFDAAVVRAKAVFKSLGHTGEVRGLSNQARKARYVLVDSNGEAWMPISELILEGDEVIEMPKRLVLGSIRNPKDYQEILFPAISVTKLRDYGNSKRKGLGSQLLH